jgi:hypothetical protein
MEDPRKLRALAGWYREFAERAGNPAIWEARLRTAKDLEREAGRLEEMATRRHEIARRVAEQGSGSSRNSRFDHGSETEGVHHEL